MSPEEVEFERRQTSIESSRSHEQMCQLKEGHCNIKDVEVDIIHSFEYQASNDESLKDESQASSSNFITNN